MSASIGIITALSGPSKERSFALAPEETTLGREAGNTIVLAGDRNVSRRHCRIFTHNKAMWIEDLGSSNGTLLTHPGLTPLRLKPNEPAILFDNSLIQIGTTQFEVSGLAEFQHEALGTVGFQFQEVIADMCQVSPSFSNEKKESYRVALKELEQHIMAAETEQELLSVIARDLQKLTTAYLMPDDLNQTIVFDPALVLPPLPDDLPEIEGDVWMDSIRNIFITDIRRCLPPEEDQDEP
jgi:pSer/pThr/pTyr-binding forkhead associated (FHA) protein